MIAGQTAGKRTPGTHLRIAILATLIVTAIPIPARADGPLPDLTHRFEYTGESFADVHGGLRRGQVYTGLAHVSVDWALAGWAVHSDAYAPHGDSFSGRDVGDFSVVSNIDAVHQVRVHELWGQRSIKGISLRAGLLAADTEFWGSDNANVFISSAFGAPSVVSGTLPHPPIFPQGVLGARLAFDLGKAGTLRLAVLDGDGGDLANENRHGFSISLNQGALLLAEYQPIFRAGTENQTSMRIGTYYHTGKFVDTHGASVHGNAGLLGVIDHAVNKRLSVFARVGAALGDRSTVPWSVETGFNLTPVFGSADRLGVGIAYVDLNDSPAVTGTPKALRHEIILESTLLIPLNTWLDLQPDIQYIVDPGGTVDSRNALVVGFRVSLHNLARAGILR